MPRRERLRWEKELLGLYLSEHPLGDIADQLPEYVTAYTGDLAEESDQAKVTLGGIIQSYAPGHHARRLDHAGGHARGPAGIGRGRRLPQGLRRDGQRLGR